MAIYALGAVEPRIDPAAYVHPDATVIGDVTVGPGSTVWPQTVLRGDYGAIVIGARTSVQDGSVLHATRQHDTIIGDDCVIGHLAHLECCTVHDGSLVGTGSIVLHRVVVESHALVGAGAVVPNDMRRAEWRDGARRARQAASRLGRRARRSSDIVAMLRRQRRSVPHRPPPSLD